MWRRRRLTGPLQGPGRLPTGPLMERLEEAHRLLQEEQYARAALAFEELARGAQIRDPNRAPQFYLQASRACIMNGEVDRAMRLVYHGLGLLAADERWLRFIKFHDQVQAELRAHGLTSQADALQPWYAQTLVPSQGSSAAQETPPAPQHPLPPVTCPACGGPLRPDEIEWVDAVTAECPFCGNLMRPEGD